MGRQQEGGVGWSPQMDTGRKLGMELILPAALGSEPHPPAHSWLRLREDTTLGQLSGGQTLVVVNSRKSQCVALRPQLYTISIAACVYLNNLCVTFMRPSWRLTKKPSEEGPCLRIPRRLCHSALLKRIGHLPSGHEGQGTGKALPQNIPWGMNPPFLPLVLTALSVLLV